MAAASNGSEFFELDIDPVRESFSRPSNAEALEEDEDELVWEAISRLPSNKRGNFAVIRKSPSEHDRSGGYGEREEMIDVRRLDRHKRELVVKKALATNAQDNYKLLSAIKERLDRVGIEVPKVEVRFENLNISAKVQTGSRALPTLINVARDLGEGLLTELGLFRAKRFPLTILNDISGVVKPGRMTLLLGPPGSGKSTLLLALAGKLAKNLKKSGNITYNGQKFDDFYVQRTSAYISQTDNHIAELTVRETLDFAACWQGASEGFGGYMEDLVRLEKERNVRPNPEVDAFMKASSVGGKKHSISTDYVLKVAFVGLVTCTLFLRTRLHPTDEMNGNLYLSCLFFGLVHMMFNGFSELSLLIFRLPVFYKQRDNLFHPAWVWSVASFILRLPYSIVEAVVWSCVVYYTVGFAPGAGRFFRFMLLLFSVHQMALGLFRTMGSIARDLIVANTFGAAALLAIFLLGGFIIPKAMIKPWWIWGYWLSPLTYGQRAISVNEFGAERWIKKSSFGNNTVGNNILYQHSLPSSDYWYWIGVGVVLLYALLFNIIVTWALTYLNPRAQEFDLNRSSLNEGSKNKGMILPFQPLTMAFHNVNYFVDMPKVCLSDGLRLP
ncbi:hypothetical protein D5086_002276 [Populus alba]|uniref:Uncharacterized protein n=1 Tax=Populus alba TaxID=43335 RepID=A0ACC4D3C1_POPAL